MGLFIAIYYYSWAFASLILAAAITTCALYVGRRA
jgi:hypothetical protein